MGPANHPIRGDVPDVAQAMANFDAISYSKGQAVLKQLGAYAGDDAFLEGLRAYFRDHAWGNTTLEDLTGAIGSASGHDLAAWETAWLDRAGTDTLVLSGDTLTVVGPDGESPRPHRLDIGCYADTGDGLRPRRRRRRCVTERSGHQGRAAGLRPAAGQRPRPHLRRRPDRPAVAGAAAAPRRRSSPTCVSRALAVTTAYDMLVKGELSADETLTCVLGVLETERVAGVVEPFLQLAGRVAQRFTPVDRIDAAAQQGRRRGRRTRRSSRSSPRAPCSSWPNNAVTAEHFAQVDEAAADDLGLAWRVATNRAARGEYDEDAVERLLERDPDPDAPFSALTVRTARPLPEAKEEAWHALYVDQSVPSGLSTYGMVMAFWQPAAARRPAARSPGATSRRCPKLAGGLMLKVGALIRGMYPDVGDQAFLDAALAMAHADGTDPTVRSGLLAGSDTLVRRLRARGELA